MSANTQLGPAAPRWKTVYDQLVSDLESFAYGSDFYTIAQVCKKFDVSQITAIRALNELASRGQIEKISGKGNVVRRVTQAVSIRFITPDATRGSYLALDTAIRRRVEGITRATTLHSLDFDMISESNLQRLFPRDGVPFGFLVPHQITRSTIRFLRRHRYPFVFVDPLEQSQPRPCARVDRVLAGYLAARHLLDHGHRRIACLIGMVNRRNVRDRLRGYRRALREANVPFRWSLIEETDGLNKPSVRAGFDRLMNLPRRPTAIIAGDDERAMDILDFCRERGIDVPEQMSVMGYPNYPESRMTYPPLSVVDAHFEKVGEAVVKLLLDQLLGVPGADQSEILIKPELVPRGSTGPVPPSKIRNISSEVKVTSNPGPSSSPSQSQTP